MRPKQGLRGKHTETRVERETLGPLEPYYNLSDPGVEDLLYEVESVRRFAGLRLSGPLPDETTILNFRHLLEPGQASPARSGRRRGGALVHTLVARVAPVVAKL